MTLPTPAATYDVTVLSSQKALLEKADRENQKRNLDYEIGSTAKLILHSPNGARWNITVSNAGVIAAVAL